jgi:hypothetical protein
MIVPLDKTSLVSQYKGAIIRGKGKGANPNEEGAVS